MSRASKIGLWSGLFGLFIVVLFGGRSVLMAGLICGVMAGLLAGARAEGDSPQAGIRDGVWAGIVAGVILLVVHLVRQLFINGLLGQNAPPIGEAVLVGLLGAVL